MGPAEPEAGGLLGPCGPGGLPNTGQPSSFSLPRSPSSVLLVTLRWHRFNKLIPQITESIPNYRHRPFLEPRELGPAATVGSARRLVQEGTRPALSTVAAVAWACTATHCGGCRGEAWACRAGLLQAVRALSPAGALMRSHLQARAPYPLPLWGQL